MTMNKIKVLDQFEYSVLEFLFYCRVDLSFFMKDDLEEKANLYLPKRKDKQIDLLNRLKKSNMLCLKDKYGKIINNKIGYTQNLKKGSYVIEITNKGGEYIAKFKTTSWSQYCNYIVNNINNNYLNIKIFLHENRLEDMLAILNKMDIDYLIHDMTYWYPLYWKQLKGGKKIEFDVGEKFFNKDLAFMLDEKCEFP